MHHAPYMAAPIRGDNASKTQTGSTIDLSIRKEQLKTEVDNAPTTTPTTPIHRRIVLNQTVDTEDQPIGLLSKLTPSTIILINHILPTMARATSMAQTTKEQVLTPRLNGGDLRRPSSSGLH